MAEDRAQFGVLGPVELTIDGTGQSLGGPKQRAVLAYLVINANRPVAVEALAQAVTVALADPSRLRALRRTVRDHAVTHFDRAAALDRYDACFRAVLDSEPLS